MSGGWRLLAAALIAAAALQPARSAFAQESAATTTSFRDPQDGWLDFSQFLDTAYGFIPLAAPITEPAVGYGAVGALAFIDRRAPGWGERGARPNIAVVGALGTENGTRGAFGGHLGSWMDGRLRTLVAVADANVNLEFFGLGGDRPPGGPGLKYSLAARGGAAGASYRLGATPLWVGARYASVNTSVDLGDPDSGLAGFTSGDLGLRLAGVTPSLTLDLRDNFFTPTDGWYVDLSVPTFREALGSDRNFQKSTLTAIGYRPLGGATFLSVRGLAETSSSGTPFYLRPYVGLRGVQALRYQGEQAASVEAELRWQFHPRFSLVGFAGAGVARSDAAQSERDKSVTAGGVGFRYLIAREFGLHMGLDVAFGPDKPVIYVVFGNAWLRP